MALNLCKLLVALTVAATASVGHGFIVNGTHINIVELQVLGVLTCQVPGSNGPATPINNATVTVNCDGGSFTLGRTNLTGTVQVVYQTLDGVLFDTSSCNATITLGDALSCKLYPPTSTTSVTLTLIKIAETLAGQVAVFVLEFVLPILR